MKRQNVDICPTENLFPEYVIEPFLGQYLVFEEDH